MNDPLPPAARYILTDRSHLHPETEDEIVDLYYQKRQNPVRIASMMNLPREVVDQVLFGPARKLPPREPGRIEKW